MTQTAAIFDLDSTLLDDASGRLFARYLRREGMLKEFIRRRDMPLFAAVITAYQMGMLSATRAAQHTAKVVAGLQVDYFWQIVRAWFDDTLVNHITDGGRETVAWHLAQGHTTVICERVQPVCCPTRRRTPQHPAPNMLRMADSWRPPHGRDSAADRIR